MSDRAEPLIARITGPVIKSQRAVFSHLYCAAVAALREQLIAEGLEPGPIPDPFLHASRLIELMILMSTSSWSPIRKLVEGYS